MTRRYCAFISYRHADNTKEGQRWAEWLHQALEHFVVPADLVGEPNLRNEPVRDSLYPIFRDKEELPAHADLSAGIRAALESSDFLIVLCSPRSAMSEWVRKEVREFKEMGKSDRILAVIIAGEPNADDPAKVREGIMLEEECFCEELRFGAVGADGCIDWKARTEPLAADLRPNGIRAEGFVTAEAYREHLTRTSSLTPERIAALAEEYRQRLEQGLFKVIAGLLGLPLFMLVNRDAAHRAALAEKEVQTQREIAEREKKLADEARAAEGEALAATRAAKRTARRLAVVGAVALVLAVLAGWLGWRAVESRGDLVSSLSLFKGAEKDGDAEKRQRENIDRIFAENGITPGTAQAAGSWLLHDLKLIPLSASDDQIREHINTMKKRFGPEYVYIRAALEYHLADRLYTQGKLTEAAQKVVLSSQLCLEASAQAANPENRLEWREDGIRMLYRAGKIYGEAKDFSRGLKLMNDAIADSPALAALYTDDKKALWEKHVKLRSYLAGKAVLTLEEAIAAGAEAAPAPMEMEQLLKSATDSMLTALENSDPKKIQESNPRFQAAKAVSKKLKKHDLATRLFKESIELADKAKEIELKIGVSEAEARLRHIKRVSDIRFCMAENFAAQQDLPKAMEQLLSATQLSQELAKAKTGDEAASLDEINAFYGDIDKIVAVADSMTKASGFDKAAAKVLLDFLMSLREHAHSEQAQCLKLLSAESHAEVGRRSKDDNAAQTIGWSLERITLSMAALRDRCLLLPANAAAPNPDAAFVEELNKMNEKLIESLDLGLELAAAIPRSEDTLIAQNQVWRLARNHGLIGDFGADPAEKIQHWLQSIKFWRLYQSMAKDRVPKDDGNIVWATECEGAYMEWIAKLGLPSMKIQTDTPEDEAVMNEILAFGKWELWEKALSKFREGVDYTPQINTLMRSANFAWHIGKYLEAAGNSIPAARQLAFAKEAREKRRLVLEDWIKDPTKSPANAGPPMERLGYFSVDSRTYLILLWNHDPEQVGKTAEDGKKLADDFCLKVPDFKVQSKEKEYNFAWAGMSIVLFDWVNADLQRKVPAHSIEECLAALASAREYQELLREFYGPSFNPTELKQIASKWLELTAGEGFKARREKEGGAKTLAEIQGWQALLDSAPK